MRLHPARSALAILAGVAVLSCVDTPTQPRAVRVVTRHASLDGPRVVVSQVYGGGGNAGATIKNDFIELFNAGNASASVSGWSVQYASSAGTSWQVTNLSGTIPPGGYYLVQEAAGTGGTVNLPTPDASGSIPMAAGAGKVWLVSTTTQQTTSCPTLNVVDQVSFGTAATNCGSGTTATLTNTTAAIRGSGGCAITGSLSADFATGAPNPRNSASATNVCDAPPPPPVVVSIIVDPADATVIQTQLQQFSAKAFDGTGHEIATTFTWSSSDPAKATVNASGLATTTGTGNVTIKATAPNLVFGSATLHINVPPAVPDVRFSEVHYDNAGTDVGEAIELEGPGGMDLTGWSVVLYNGNGGVSYSTTVLAEAFPTRCSGRGVIVIDYPQNGVQNGGTNGAEPDGIALIDADGHVVEFLSYEGSFTATNGPATGRASLNMGVAEEPPPATGLSLQRNSLGVWQPASANSFGRCNSEGPAPPAAGISFSGRDAVQDPPLPVGFESQIFATERDGSTGAIVNTTFTWTSDTPSLASVDARGVIHSLAAGSATFRATATDGTTATFSLPMAVGVASTTALYGNNAEFGEPADGDASDDFIVRRPQYTLSYSSTRNTPNWVAYDLDATHIGSNDRCNCFTHDPALPSSFTHLTTADYTGAGSFAGYGIDRGHMTRSFDRTTGTLDNALTFYLSNVVPQAADLNQGPWANMENDLGNFARNQNKEVYIITGPAGNKGTVKGEGVIVIPTHTWKVALILPRDQGLANVHTYMDVQVIAVIMPNEPGVRNVNWHTYETTVDAVEALSGYDLLALLPDKIEAAVESGTMPPLGNAGGPYSSLEGSSVTLSGSAFDNGSITSYAWNFGDGTTGTGASVTHTYAQNGTYTVHLVVTDNDGLTDDVTTTVAVSNVAPSIASFSGATLIEGQTYATSGSFTDPGADAWTATVDYGDGSGVQVLPLSGGSFALSHTYTHFGLYSVAVRINDGDDTGMQFATVRVRARPTANAGGPYTSTEGASVALNGAASSDADGSIVRYDWSFGDGSSALDAGANVSHTYAQDGAYTVMLTVRDNDGLENFVTTTVAVANVAPSISAFSGATLLPGETYSASGSFTDPGADTWTAFVGYDGSGESALALSGMRFSLSHVYTTSGTFTVTVRISDDDVTSSRTAIVTVLTPAQGVQDIIALVQGTNSLKAKLEAAINQLERGNTKPAVNQLGAFLNEVDAMVRSGRMSATDADVLRAAINRVVRSVTG